MVKIFLNKELKDILKNKNISVNDYIPAYNGESAGLDLYNTLDETIYLSPPLEYYNLLIPTGLRVSIPKGYVGLIQERGSITKTSLKVRAGVIDSGYTGEIFVNCVNIGNSTFTIYPKEKLPFQIVVVKCDNQFEVIEEEEYLNLSSSSRRKEGMVGSSD